MKPTSWLAATLFSAGIWTLHSSLVTPQAAPPEKVVKNFLNAVQKGDFEKAKKYCDDNTDKLMDLMKMMSENIQQDKTVSKHKIKTVECDVDGEVGVCKACCTTEGEPLSDVQVKKVNGQWQVVMNKEDMNKETPPSEEIIEPEED